MTLTSSAQDIAKQHLADDLPVRWKHVCAVAAKAGQVPHAFTEADYKILVASAWLHDIGYSPSIRSTGLHALDGARWLRQRGFNERVNALVAHHSCAIFEAREYGLEDKLSSEFDNEESPVTDALWYCDMTTGPNGESLEVDERLAEIRTRYGPDHAVTRFWMHAEPVLVAAVQRTRRRLSAAGVQPM